jgi:hypothetical protein
VKNKKHFVEFNYMKLLTSVQYSEKELQVSQHFSLLFVVMFTAPSVPSTTSPRLSFQLSTRLAHLLTLVSILPLSHALSSNYNVTAILQYFTDN